MRQKKLCAPKVANVFGKEVTVKRIRKKKTRGRKTKKRVRGEKKKTAHRRGGWGGNKKKKTRKRNRSLQVEKNSVRLGKHRNLGGERGGS